MTWNVYIDKITPHAKFQFFPKSCFWVTAFYVIQNSHWLTVCKVFGTQPNSPYLWCDQAKSVWSRSYSVFIFLTNCMHHFHNYNLQKTPLKLVTWFQRYEQLKDVKNSRKQKTFSALFGSILKPIFPTSDWFCLITSHLLFFWKHD